MSLVDLSTSRMTTLDGLGTPADLLHRWPEHRPLACLVSAGASARGSRWSIFAEPVGVVTCEQRDDGSTSSRWRSFDPEATDDPWSPRELPHDPLALLDVLRPANGRPHATTVTPFVGGWIGAMSYDLGRIIEPAAQHRRDARPADDLPLLTLLRCPHALIHDGLDGSWRWVSLDGRSPADLLSELVPHGRSFACGPARSDFGEPAYINAVARAIELIRDGHVFQANLAHQLHAAFTGSPRAMMSALLASAAPGFGAYMEVRAVKDLDAVICSISPELFLDVDFTTRELLTRPIKGTRSAAAAAAQDELEHSDKDHAELAMIVDLMRNDLGRVCEFGSVRVREARTIDRHGPERGDGALYHASAAISGTLRSNVGLGGLIGATFPPGSVTGAPKVRAMQIIDELEPARRGPYCGCIGMISEHGRSVWNVAIRTAVLRCERGSTLADSRGTLTYPVGAGIVADSDPEQEWHETMAKAAMFLRALDRNADSPR